MRRLEMQRQACMPPRGCASAAANATRAAHKPRGVPPPVSPSTYHISWWRAACLHGIQHTGCVYAGSGHMNVQRHRMGSRQTAGIQESRQMKAQQGTDGYVQEGWAGRMQPSSKNRVSSRARRLMQRCVGRRGTGQAGRAASHAPRPRPQQDGWHVAPVRVAPALKVARHQRVLHRLRLRHAQAVLLHRGGQGRFLRASRAGARAACKGPCWSGPRRTHVSC